MLDPLPVSAVTAFRERLPAILDSDAAESVRVISETDNLDEAARAMLIAAMTGLASSLSAIKNDTSHDIVSHNPERTGEKA